MSKKNRGNSPELSAEAELAELMAQDAGGEQTSQNEPEGSVIDNGTVDESNGTVGSAGSEPGTEDATGELVTDLPADSGPEGVSVELTNEDIAAPEIDGTIPETPALDNADASSEASDPASGSEPVFLELAPAIEEPAAVPEEPVIAEQVAQVASVTKVGDAVVVEVAESEVERPAVQKLRERLAGVLDGDALAAFDSVALTLFDEKRVIPQKTSHLEWPVDIRRTKNMSTWTDGALVDWANGEIKTPPGIEEAALHDELYRRYRLPGNWTESAAVHYINTGVKPAYTDKGVLIEDRTRATAIIQHWTFKELKAALLGEIDTLGHATEDLVKVLRQRLGLSEATSHEKILESLNTDTDEVTMDNVLLDAKLSEFKNAITSKGANLSADSAGKAQKVLAETIRKVMAREPQAFHEGWLKLLNFVNAEYNTLFTPEKARRGWAQINLSVSAVRTYEDVLTLLINTRNPATRAQDVKQHNIERMLKYVSEADRQNVIQFYQSAGQ